MEIVCLDLEGVLLPEIWVGVAEKTGIEDLRLTTRDVPDYGKLMEQRLQILEEHSLHLSIVHDVVSELKPLKGAIKFLEWLNTKFQVIILSDTFYEFARPLIGQLGWPTLLCHSLEIGKEGRIIDYHLRMKDHKREAVKAFKSLNYNVFSAGDSYNDVSMLSESDSGFLFQAPQNVIDEFPQFPSILEYDGLKQQLIEISPRLLDD